ncbi:MAG: hypothetical protein H6625_05435 [Bdellovibrionaceae bacterium]|nr:hypothetical protein [Pseudobdellovibrionaceae bacterium]
MNKVFLLAMAFLLSSCNEGQDVILKLSETIIFNTRYNKAVKMDAGDYNIKVSHDKKSQYLKFEVPREDEGPDFPDDVGPKRNRPYEIQFKYTDETQIPDDNGEFFISHLESGQLVDMMGKIETRLIKGELKREYEICETQKRRTGCYADRQGRVICGEHWEIVHGRREVEFLPITTIKTLEINLTYPNKNYESANLLLKESKISREYTYWGTCI